MRGHRKIFDYPVDPRDTRNRAMYPRTVEEAEAWIQAERNYVASLQRDMDRANELIARFEGDKARMIQRHEESMAWNARDGEF